MKEKYGGYVIMYHAQQTYLTLNVNMNGKQRYQIAVKEDQDVRIAVEDDVAYITQLQLVIQKLLQNGTMKKMEIKNRLIIHMVHI